MNLKIIRLSIFESDSFGNGAEKRTAQLTEILSEENINLQKVPEPGYNSNDFKTLFHNFYIKASSLFVVVKIIGWKFSLLRIYKTFRLNFSFKGFTSILKEEFFPVLLWEVTRMELAFAIPLFKKMGFKIIGIPHNIESLVPGNYSAITNVKSPFWLYEEVMMLSKCEEVFAISKEDTLLLRQFGINAKYLPYYPAQDNLKYLLSIREARREKHTYTSVKNILMLGSAINLPTLQGMINRIGFFTKEKISTCKITIAGFGTEKLKEFCKGYNNIIVLGELSNQQLIEVLINTDAILIHQPATSGSLTRIPEMLLAGIPVISNFEGARNYYDTEGVHVYSDDNQLLNFLAGINLKTPVLFERPTDAIKDFKITLSKYCNKELY